MTATKDTKKKRRQESPAVGAGDSGGAAQRDASMAASTHAARDAGKDAGTRRSGREPKRVKSRDVAARIRGIADRCESLESRRPLRRLARLVAANPKNVRKVAFIETGLGECLELAAQPAHHRDQWLLREAATWGLAWLARSRRAGGSAGGLLEQFVQQARAATAALQGRDTAPAAFMLTLARLFSDIEACRRLQQPALNALEEEIGRLVSDAGIVGLTGSAAMVERVCRWASCHHLFGDAPASGWSEATARRFAASLSTAVRLLGGAGRMLSGAGRMPRGITAPLLAAARCCRSDRKLRRTAKVVEAGQRGPAAGKGLLSRDLDDPAAAVAMLRSGWGSDALRILVDYRAAIPRLEIAVGDRLIVDGEWRWSVNRDGQPLQAEGPWTRSCLESDRKATFFEIAAPLSGGLRIERSIAVLPADRVIVLADVITRDAQTSAADLRYAAVVPLGVGLEAEQADETREVVAYDTAMRCLAMPLGLPEWKTAGRGGFAATADGLVLEQHGSGRLHAPVWLHCNPRRIGGQLTWRHLTVADTRINVPPSMAAGYRVQVGRDQWLLYRALDEPRNRTLLGCNVSCEFLLGRIGRTGIVRRKIEIE